MAACIRGPRTLAISSDLNHKNSSNNYKAFIKTYSKWVNHYLEKARSKKLIQDLQADLTDGVLLADVIEAVTSHKVPNINRKPKTATQMCENIQACLCFLEQIGIALDGINVREVREGNLKAALGLIFALSVHKQRQKQQQQQQQQVSVTPERDKHQKLSSHATNQDSSSGLTKLPSPFCNNTNDSSSGGSGIPTPAPGARLSGIERYNGLNTAVSPLKSASTNSSRSASPSHSFIPAPRVSACNSLNEKQLTGSSGMPRCSNVPTRVSLASPYNPANGKTSILFAPKEKPKSSTGSTKRTSSSSGFSSARSERSDSSSSLYNDPKQIVSEKKIPTATDSGLRKKMLKPGESKVATRPGSKTQQPRPLSKAALDKQNELTNSFSSETNESSRLSIGGGSSIPKPLAAVKGTSKPTHCVSPMPVEQTTIVIENDKSIKKKENDDEKKAKEEISETEKIVPPVVNNHTKQASVEEEDCSLNIKPMQPMRGYPKQNGTPQRTHLSSEQIAMHHQTIAAQSQNYLRHMENNRAMLNSDHSMMNGYLSDGEVLQNGSSVRSVSDYCDGYMSEGTAIYSNPPNHQRSLPHNQTGKESKPQFVQRILVRPKTKKLNDDQLKSDESKSPSSSTNTSENHVKVLVGDHQVISSMDYRGTNGGESSPAIIYRSGRSHVKKSDSSQQTETSAFPAKQWNSDSSRMPEKRIITQRKLDKKSSDSHSREELGCIEYCNGDRKLSIRESKNKVRGVPPSFGYTKRPTNGDGGKGETRTAQVSAVPRTKVKVSGGTQTETTNNSQSVRDRISTFPRTSYSSHVPGDLSEAESLPASQSHHRVSLARLSRSNSIRSTKSEKVYPSMLQRSEEIEPYYNIPYNLHHSSQPTSPTPSQMSQGTLSRMYYQMWPGGGGSMWSARNMGLLVKVGSKDDEIHGSAVSLYSTPEEKQGLEVRKLRRQLVDAHDKVHTLTTQLSTNAHVVSAFEQSLSNMTQRLQQLTATTEKKDSELNELRQTIERLSKQGSDCGLSSGNMSPSLARRHTINTTAGSTISRQLSTDSVSSLNSLSSANSTQQSDSEKKKKRGWLRSSFSKAFTRPKKSRSGSASDAEVNDTSVPSSPLLNTPHLMNGDLSQQAVKLSHSSSALCDRSTEDIVDELRRQLREKDLVLTDIRLEALSSAHQLESLKDTVINMRNEMLNLKQDNDRLQRIVTTKSLASSQSSLPLSDLTDAPIAESLIDPILCENDGKKIMVSVYLGAHGSYNKYVEEGCDISIGYITVGCKTKWDILDSSVKRCFKDYLEKLDPGSCLGLGIESLWSYHVGEITRYKESPVPELLPYGYLVGDTTSIPICLKGSLHNSAIDALAFQTLIPKPIIQRYVTLLTEHRRIILCGPSGTGKSYLASKLADFLVLRLGKDSNTGAVATINVEHKSNKELKGWLCNIAETCETEMLPSVIVLDNLHHAADSLAELFNGFTTAKYPYIIGTISQATTSTTDLQLHHNFRWILCVNHMEPVKGLLGRILRRKIVDIESRSGRRNTELSRVVEWLPRVWHHLNQFLETHCSSDVTIGPRVFVGCPLESGSAQAWFTDVWNYSVIPYLQDMVREGLQLYGKRAPWHDPASFVVHTYPWPGDPSNLQRLSPEDVGYDTQNDTNSKSAASESDADPLLNMLMRLQEAANYSSPLSNDSDVNSRSGIESTL